jgi:hypothetical protein
VVAFMSHGDSLDSVGGGVKKSRNKLTTWLERVEELKIQTDHSLVIRFIYI